MKVEVTTKEKQFEPIKLSITIESKEELHTWLSIFNGFTLPIFTRAVENNKSMYASGKLKFDYQSSVEAYELLQKHVTS